MPHSPEVENVESLSQIMSDFVGIIYARIGSKNTLELIKLCYHDPSGLQEKLPGGGRKLGETLEACAVREGGEEVGLVPNKIHFLSSALYSNDSGSGYHRKTFFLALEHECTGSLRTDPEWDGDTLLDRPEWVEAEHFLEIGFYTHLPPVHQVIAELRVHS